MSWSHNRHAPAGYPPVNQSGINHGTENPINAQAGAASSYLPLGVSYARGPSDVKPHAISSMIPLGTTFPLGSTLGNEQPQTPQIEAVRKHTRLEDLCPSGLRLLPVPSPYKTLPQYTIEMRTTYQHAVRVFDFARPDSASLAWTLVGANGPVLHQNGEMRYRIKWPGYHYREYSIFIHPQKTRLEFVQEICRIMLEYLQNRIVEAGWNVTYEPWIIGNDALPIQGGLPEEHIWLDSLAYCPKEDCYVPQFYVQRV